MKRFTDLYSVDDFLEYYNAAGRIELKRRLKQLKNKNGIQQKNEKKAIQSLLA